MVLTGGILPHTNNLVTELSNLGSSWQVAGPQRDSQKTENICFLTPTHICSEVLMHTNLAIWTIQAVTRALPPLTVGRWEHACGVYKTVEGDTRWVFYRTRVRSLSCLDTDWLTNWLTNIVDTWLMWLAQLKTSWCCLCCWCWTHFGRDFETEVWLRF